MMIEIILFIIILGILVLSHEFGHFLAAKLSGMRVDEFAFGFPPRLFRKKMGETRYAFNLIPFGGYVKIYGEDGGKTPRRDDPDYGRRFTSKPLLSQAFVIVSGVLFNFILAWLLFAIGFMVGFPAITEGFNPEYVKDESIIITSVAPGSPADISGLTVGTQIISVSRVGDSQNINSTEDLSAFIDGRGDSITLGVITGENEQSIDLIPVEGIIADKVAIGVGLDKIGIVQLPIHRALWDSLIRTGELTIATVRGISNLIIDAIRGGASFDTISGPIGIYNLVGEAQQLGIMYVIGFTAIISISLGVINLLPFPALDGGRLLFVIIEAIKGSPIRPQVANAVNFLGFAILIGLMLLVTYGDLLKLGIFS